MFQTINNYFWWLLGWDEYPDPYLHDPNIVSITKYLDAVDEKKNLKYYYDTSKNHYTD